MAVGGPVIPRTANWAALTPDLAAQPQCSRLTVPPARLASMMPLAIEHAMPIASCTTSALPPSNRATAAAEPMVPQIEVAFDIDANGIVHVSAKDMATKKEQSIQITASSGLSKEEIETLVREGEEHAEEDKQKRALVEVMNEADTLVYNVEKSLNEHGDKVSEEEKADIQTKIASTREAMKGIDPEAIRTEIAALSQASHKLAEEMYTKAAAEQGVAQDSPEAQDGNSEEVDKEKPDAKVVEAEFTEKESN